MDIAEAQAKLPYNECCCVCLLYVYGSAVVREQERQLLVTHMGMYLNSR
jgi:hypothetical protein